MGMDLYLERGDHGSPYSDYEQGRRSRQAEINALEEENKELRLIKARLLFMKQTMQSIYNINPETGDMVINLIDMALTGKEFDSTDDPR